MKKFLCLLVVSLGLLTASSAVDAAEKTVHWAILLELPTSVAQIDGLKDGSIAALADQLQRVGYDANHIVQVDVKSGGSPIDAFAKTIEKVSGEMVGKVDGQVVDNSVLIYIAGRGLHVEQSDVLQMREIAADDWADTAKLTAAIWKLSEIVQKLVQLPSKRQCVVIDGASRGAVSEALTKGFGSEALPVDEGQVVMLNRANQLNKARTGTVFQQGITHALRGHANTDNKDGVSLLEFSEYLLLYAVAHDIAKPVTYGRTANVFAMSRGNSDEVLRSQSLRDELALRLVRAARTSLLVEGDIAAAATAAEGAAEYAINEKVKDEAIMLLLTTRVAQGQFKDAWAEAEKRKLPLLAYASKKIAITSAEEELGSAQRGELILVSKTDESGSWARAAQIMKIDLLRKDGATEARSTGGWVKVSDLTVDPKSVPALPDVLRPALR